MPTDSRLELTIEVDANRANASIMTVNASLSTMEAAAAKQVAAIEETGFEFTEAAHAVQRLIVADMDLAKKSSRAPREPSLGR